MGVLTGMYNIEFSVLRKDTISATSSDSIVTVGTYEGVIRPIADISQLFSIANIGKEYKLFTDSTADIRANDTITVGATTYGVAGISDFEDLDNATETHLEIRIYET